MRPQEILREKAVFSTGVTNERLLTMLSNKILRLCNEASTNQPTHFIGAANALALDADGWAFMPFGDSHHNAMDGRLAANAKVPEALRKGVIQRFDRASADAIVADFRSLWGRVKRAVVGLPVFRGHPDAPRFANIFPDKTPRGTIADMEITEAGLKIRPVLTREGLQDIESGLSEFSPYWDLQLANESDPTTGLPVYSPFRLHSIGLVRRGNIPGLSLVNADLTTMKNWLIKLLAALGIAVPPDTADDALEPFVQGAIDKLTAMQAEAGKKAEMEVELQTANSSITELKGKLATLETEKVSLVNDRDAAQGSLKAERQARAALVVDQAVATGRVSAADRTAKVTSLANAADFAAEAAALLKAKPALSTQSRLAGLSQDGLEQQSRQNQLLSLVNARMSETGEEYSVAFAAVQGSEAGKAILATMKRPEAVTK